VCGGLEQRGVVPSGDAGGRPALESILPEVRAAGIVLLSDGDDIAGERTLWVSYTDPGGLR
jgi:hypothetical protein